MGDIHATVFPLQWPGAMPLDQWIRETAGFDDIPKFPFWIITETKKSKDKASRIVRYDRSCRESVRSLLSNFIQQWTPQDKKRPIQILCQGFAWQPPHTKPIQKHLNAAVDYWISSAETIALHRAIGDDLLRHLWRFPVVKAIAQNAWQICGVPLHWKAKHEKVEERPRKRRRRFQYRTVVVPKVLQPHFCLVRRNHHLYKNIYTQKVGKGTKLDAFETPEALLRAMLFEYCSSGVKEHSIDVLMEERWRPVCAEILRNHDRLDYHRILQACCPMAMDYKEQSLPDLVQSYCSSMQLTKFCQAILSKLLPDAFWGHTKNRTRFLEHSIPIICSLRRHDRFPNHQLLSGVKTNRIKWLEDTLQSGGRNDHALLHQRVLCVLRWWIQRFLWQDLLPRIFYATDTEFLGKQDIVYYRNPIWALIRQRSLQTLRQYERLKDCPESGPVSRLRLLPKATGIRPIATLHISDLIGRKSSNGLLTNAFTVLSHCIRPEESYGAGMQGLHELHGRYREYILKHKTEKLYFCSVDIRHCYDNIQVDYLLQLLENKVLKQPEYLIQKFFVMFPNGTVKKRTVVGRPGDCQTFAENMVDWQDDMEGGIFIDGVQQLIVSSRDIVDAIREHFQKNTVVVKGRYGDRFYRQTEGIPQGSIISTLSCNVYYGDMERQMGVHDVSPSSLLARMMDDFLFIATDPVDRNVFHSRVSKGIPSKGVEIHPDKTRLSETQDEWFAWCGFLFHVDSGQVRLDYSRFQNGVVSGSLTADWNHPGEHLRIQMQTFCRPRCLPLLYDCAIQSHSNRMYNFYQLMAFAWVKTIMYDLPLTRNETFWSSALENTLRFAYGLIVSRLKPFEGNASSFLSYRDAQWLGYTAWNDIADEQYCRLEVPSVSRQRQLESVATQALADLSLDQLVSLHER